MTTGSGASHATIIKIEEEESDLPDWLVQTQPHGLQRLWRPQRFILMVL